MYFIKQLSVTLRSHAWKEAARIISQGRHKEEIGGILPAAFYAQQNSITTYRCTVNVMLLNYSND